MPDLGNSGVLTIFPSSDYHGFKISLCVATTIRLDTWLKFKRNDFLSVSNSICQSSEPSVAKSILCILRTYSWVNGEGML